MSFFKIKSKFKPKRVKNSEILFQEEGIIDVTNFEAKSPEDSLGYLTSCKIFILSDGIVRACKYDDENNVLETIVVENIVHIVDPSYTAIELITEDKSFCFDFESIEIKKCFVNTLKVL